MSVVNPHFNHYQERCYIIGQTLKRMVLMLTWLLTVSGAKVIKGSSLMLVLSIPSQSYTDMTLPACYKCAKELKKRKYEQRIREIEHGSFSPLMFGTTGGVGPTASLFLKRLALLLSEKNQRPYSINMNLIRCKYSFSVLHSSIPCLRGSRSSTYCDSPFPTTSSNDVDRAISEGQFTISI